MNAFDFTAPDLSGAIRSLADWRGHLLLIVNVASKCGFTPQYAGLEQLYRRYKDQGLVILGFPCDQFGHQEPGNEAAIELFCSTTYDVTFPMFAKVEVNGPDTHPLYRYLKTAQKGILRSEAIKWNFTKFLVGRDGQVLERFGSAVTPAQIEKKIAGLLSLLLLFLLPVLGGCEPSHRHHTVADSATIDSAAVALMKREDVQGLAIAVIDSGTVRHVAAFGMRNTERNLPLTTQTIMYGASLTKSAFAYMVLQLVDEGKVDLDAPIATLLPRPLPEYKDYTDLAADDRWRTLTPRMVLNHTTGFANFRWLEPDKVLRFHSDPGTRYGYSAEGFYILQFALEEGLGLDVGKEMQTRVFDRFGMTRTSMTWRPDFATDLADGYRVDGTMEPHDERSNVSAAGSMDTDIDDQARLWAGILRGDGLSAAARAELVRPQASITSSHQFPTLKPDTGPHNAAIGLSAGLGLVTFQDPSGLGWFKGGHNESTGNMVLCLETGKRCVVMLSNDVRAERIYTELARVVLGETAMPWWWEYN